MTLLAQFFPRRLSFPQQATCLGNAYDDDKLLYILHDSVIRFRSTFIVSYDYTFFVTLGRFLMSISSVNQERQFIVANAIHHGPGGHQISRT